jgi:cyclic pyranopterin phosphate synthase
VQQLAEIEEIQAVHLTTNGTTLRSLAPVLRASGLAGINISLDTLQRARFTYVTGADRFDEVFAGIHAALDAGFPVRLNVVVMAGLNDDELLDFVALACNMPLDIRFIEHMPFGRQDWQPERCVTMDAMMREIGTHYPLVPISRVSGHAGFAREYRVAGAQGTIGFIAPVSQPFCAHCTRLRLTATGWLQTCLFTAPELELVAALRSGVPEDVLAQQLQKALAWKPRERPALTALSQHAAPAMRMIGG